MICRVHTYIPDSHPNSRDLPIRSERRTWANEKYSDDVFLQHAALLDDAKRSAAPRRTARHATLAESETPRTLSREAKATTEHATEVGPGSTTLSTVRAENSRPTSRARGSITFPQR